MARDEQDREDLLAEASALVERAEIELDGQSIVVGFRRDGSASVFFGSDPVYQFNAAGELRRAFVAGLLYKAVGGGLASLRRQRTADEVQLVRHDLTPGETQVFLATMQQRLASLQETLQQKQHRLVGNVPAEVDVVKRAQEWLRKLPPHPAIAKTPRVGG